MDKLYRILHIPSATLVCYSQYDTVFVLKEDKAWYNKNAWHEFYITKARFNYIINSKHFCVFVKQGIATTGNCPGLKDEFELID